MLTAGRNEKTAGGTSLASSPGIDLPGPPDQIALFVFAGRRSHETIGGGRILLIKDFMREILYVVREGSVASAAILEEYCLLGTLQFAAQ